MRSVWYEGFAKDKDGGRTPKYKWKQLYVVLAGGGLRRQGLQEVIESSPPLNAGYFVEQTEYTFDWHSPGDLSFDGGSLGFDFRDPLDSPAYLAVAHGLSLERMHWPKFCYPGDVEELKSDPELRIPTTPLLGVKRWVKGKSVKRILTLLSPSGGSRS